MLYVSECQKLKNKNKSLVFGYRYQKGASDLILESSVYINSTTLCMQCNRSLALEDYNNLKWNPYCAHEINFPASNLAFIGFGVFHYLNNHIWTVKKYKLIVSGNPLQLAGKLGGVCSSRFSSNQFFIF